VSIKAKTAYCGIYCPDCMLFKNKFSPLATQLKERLEDTEFEKYAGTPSPFGQDYTCYNQFSTILEALAGSQCNQTCRTGGGCSGKPCEIMECCLSKNYEGCWDCDDVENCNKFDFLTPRCGDMPKSNILAIKKHGMQNWEQYKKAFYIWQG